jgi:uncharacterized protein YndB with AHSA1/START domain
MAGRLMPGRRSTRQVLAADILVLCGPIWLGDNSSVMKRVIERLCACSSLLNEAGQYSYYGRVGGCLLTGNEDGVKHCAMNVLYSLQHLGYTIPPQADAGWIGEAGPGPSYLDPGSGGPENDFTNRNTTFATWNLMHLGAMLKRADGIPAHGNQRSEVGGRLPLRLREPRTPLKRPRPRGPGRDRVSAAVTRPLSSRTKVLRDAGLVRGRVDGRRRLYRVDLQGLERLRRELDAYWGPGPGRAQGGRRGRGPAVRLLSYQVRIAAPVEVVWAHLTTAEGLVRWVGSEATADPTPGGMLRWVHPNGATVVGRFVELVPHRRVVFSYGWEDDRLGVPPGSTTVEIDLVEEAGATTLRLVHHGLPPATAPDHEQGWAYFLGVLRDTLSAG